MPVTDDDELREILRTERVTVIGASTTPGKDAHEIPAYLQRAGYTVVPVNPFADEILGETAYDEIADVPGPIELLDVFRPSEEVAGIVDAAIERGDVDVIWLQLGVHDDAAVDRAEAAGITVVEDRCIKVEHRRLLG